MNIHKHTRLTLIDRASRKAACEGASFDNFTLHFVTGFIGLCF